MLKGVSEKTSAGCPLMAGRFSTGCSDGSKLVDYKDHRVLWRVAFDFVECELIVHVVGALPGGEAETGSEGTSATGSAALLRGCSDLTSLKSRWILL